MIDPVSSNFTANITVVRIGFSRAILSFVVSDPADAGENNGDVSSTVFGINVVNEECSEAMRMKLEWNSNDHTELSVTDPNGHTISNHPQAMVSVLS